jgi:hypothetical protein
VQRYSAALSAGWTDVELRKIGFDEPDKNSPGARNVTGVALTPDGLWKVDREREDTGMKA